VPGGDDADTGLLAKIRIAIEAGVDWVQIREKDLATGRVLALAREAVSASESHGHGSQSQLVRTKVIVNDRLDVALAANAAGIHLGRESAPVREVANWCRAGNAPGEFLIGASCHTSYAPAARRISLARATSAGVSAATTASCPDAQAAALPGVCVQTVSGKPARATRAAIREPMIPRPRKPTDRRSSSSGMARAYDFEALRPPRAPDPRCPRGAGGRGNSRCAIAAHAGRRRLCAWSRDIGVPCR